MFSETFRRRTVSVVLQTYLLVCGTVLPGLVRRRQYLVGLGQPDQPEPPPPAPSVLMLKVGPLLLRAQGLGHRVTDALKGLRGSV